MDELQVYDDLIQLDISEYKERIDELEQHINKLNADIQTLCSKMLDMKKSQESLIKNISALYSTAKNEIQRKDRMIAQLRKEKDDILFKKGQYCGNKRTYSRSRSKSRENKKGKYNTEGVKRDLPKISEDKNKQRISREKEQVNKTTEKEHIKSTDNKKRLNISEYKASRSNNDKDISKTKRDVVKNTYPKEKAKNNHPSKSYYRKETENTSSKLANDNKKSEREEKADLRDKLKSKGSKSDLLKPLSDKESLKSAQNTIIISPSKKRLIKQDDDMEDGEINDDSIIIDLSSDDNGTEMRLKTDLIKFGGSSNALENKNRDLIRCEESKKTTREPQFALKPSQFMSDIITEADMAGDNVAVTKINEDNIVELHIRKKSEEFSTAPENSAKENDLITRIEENTTVVPLENDISVNNDSIRVYQNNENVNTSNNSDFSQTEEKITPNISANSNRRRRRAIVFIS